MTLSTKQLEKKQRMLIDIFLSMTSKLHEISVYMNVTVIETLGPVLPPYQVCLDPFPPL